MKKHWALLLGMCAGTILMQFTWFASETLDFCSRGEFRVAFDRISWLFLFWAAGSMLDWYDNYRETGKK